MDNKRFARIGALLMGVGALILWVASRGRWMTVHYTDDRTGGGEVVVNGATWSTEVTAVVLLLLAAMVAAFALRRGGRRIVGIIGALAGAAVMFAPVSLLVGAPDLDRVKALLTYGGEETTIGSTAGQTAITEWAHISAVDVIMWGPLSAALGALVAVSGGIMLALRPGKDPAAVDKYERASQRREKIERDLEADPDSGRVLWDAIDADIDPTTEPSAGPSSASATNPTSSAKKSRPK